MKKDVNTKKQLFENMEKLNPEFKLLEGVNFNMIFDRGDYKSKVREIKIKLDELVKNEEDDIIDTLYRLIVRRTAPNHTPEQLKEIFNKFEKHGH